MLKILFPSLLVAAGGALGAWLRFVLGHFIKMIFPYAFPLATLAINVLACFAIGLQLSKPQSENSKAFVVLGLLGGFSTFSALGYESWQMIRGGEYSNFLIYILLSIILGVIAVGVGHHAGS